MNEKNYDYLSRQVKFTGFGEGHAETLKEKLLEQPRDFVLFHQAEFGKDSVVATLQFRKSEESDMYFFNRYSVVLKNEANPDMVKQTFYVGKNQDNITLKEAYNLMSGRAIYKEMTPKEGEQYHAWLQMDFKEADANGNFKFKQYHTNYGYDLYKALGAHPIKEMYDPGLRQNLVQSLERGNRQAVTLDINGKEQRLFIEAVPQFKSINFYDASMKRVNIQKIYESKEESATASAKASVKEQSSPKADDEEGPAPRQRNAKKKGQKIS